MSARGTLLGIVRQWAQGYDLDGTPEELLDAHAAEVIANELHQAANEIDQAQSRLVAKKTVVNILRRHANTAREKTTTTAATATPFFQVGHTYTEPDDTTDWRFRCDSITTHPNDGERTALGWRHFHGEWEPYAYGEDDFEIHQIADHIGTTGEAPRG